MKKIIILGLVLLMVVVFATTVLFAIEQEGIGAVKLVLNEREPGNPKGGAGTGPEIGWAIVNTNDDGELIVQVHLDEGAPGKLFGVYIKVNGEAHWPTPDVQLTTNSKGKGNAHVILNLTDEYKPYTGETINVQVVALLLPENSFVGYATDTEPVPLKK